MALRQKTVINNRIVISFFIFFSLGLIGLLFPSVGASLPFIEDHFNLSLSSSGQASSLIQLGYALFSFIGGIFCDSISKKYVLASGTGHIWNIGTSAEYFTCLGKFAYNFFILRNRKRTYLYKQPICL